MSHKYEEDGIDETIREEDEFDINTETIYNNVQVSESIFNEDINQSCNFDDTDIREIDSITSESRSDLDFRSIATSNHNSIKGKLIINIELYSPLCAW